VAVVAHEPDDLDIYLTKPGIQGVYRSFETICEQQTRERLEPPPKPKSESLKGLGYIAAVSQDKELRKELDSTCLTMLSRELEQVKADVARASEKEEEWRSKLADAPHGLRRKMHQREHKAAVKAKCNALHTKHLVETKIFKLKNQITLLVKDLASGNEGQGQATAEKEGAGPRAASRRLTLCLQSQSLV